MSFTDAIVTDTVVSLEGIEKRYGQVEVLKGVDLQVRKGNAVAVIGPSGSGKTTLLRCVNGLETPAAGVVQVGRHRIDYGSVGSRGTRHKRALNTLRQDCGMVFQHFNLFPNMTVMENIIEAPVNVMGLKKAEAEAKAEGLLDKVGMAWKKDARPSELSGGQQQRIAIARALAMDPEILLLDEVTSALDPELVGEVLAVLKDIAAETDISMLIVTHEMQFARDVSDRVMMFDKGSVIEQGVPDKIFSEPEHKRTQEFLHAIL